MKTNKSNKKVTTRRDDLSVSKAFNLGLGYSELIQKGLIDDLRVEHDSRGQFTTWTFKVTALGRLVGNVRGLEKSGRNRVLSLTPSAGRLLADTLAMDRI